uniref:Metal dependent phosphohydrolase n=2 Tax=unclassified bacterial viruses TaxID=12333 RepID=A0AAU6VZ62_9VIRU
MLDLEKRAEAYATEKHKGQKYGEHDYIYHLRQVVENVIKRNQGHPLLSTLIAIAWLHDVLEDTDTTYKELEREFGTAVAFCVARLSKHPDLSYQEYMELIVAAALAREVKICDTMANMVESIKSGNAKGLVKYPRQLTILVTGVYYE